MDDKIKSALQSIIGSQRGQSPGTARGGRAAADAYIALWKSQMKRVVQPAFKEFSQHLASEYKFPSYVDDCNEMSVLTEITDPGIRFIFGERPMFGEDSDASSFELRCVSATQTLKASFEVHDGANVLSGSVEGTVALKDLSADWIHKQLAQVMAKSYGQELPSEDAPAAESPEAETPPPESSAQDTPLTEDSPAEEAPSSSPDAPAQETTPPESSADESPSAQLGAPESNQPTDSTDVRTPDPYRQDNQAPDDAADAQNPAQDPKDPPP